jgi:hypothetical protein
MGLRPNGQVSIRQPSRAALCQTGPQFTSHAATRHSLRFESPPLDDGCADPAAEALGAVLRSNLAAHLAEQASTWCC